MAFCGNLASGNKCQHSMLPLYRSCTVIKIFPITCCILLLTRGTTSTAAEVSRYLSHKTCYNWASRCCQLAKSDLYLFHLFFYQKQQLSFPKTVSLGLSLCFLMLVMMVNNMNWPVIHDWLEYFLLIGSEICVVIST